MPENLNIYYKSNSSIASSKVCANGDDKSIFEYYSDKMLEHYDELIFYEWLALNIILILVALVLFYKHYKEKQDAARQDRLIT